ncbi:alpha-amylase family glycosyl hydrolase [Paracidobacterium acidisoli]|nr:alpha-amylase family glycosyl hydrolase [Paracidobacterium acidisoli]
MPNVVMVAKSTYVWLSQLSRQYNRAIERLDQIPDEELDLLSRRGLNALWLIGIWERSPASQTIKRLCGQPDAVASAYSLSSYHIAWDLGGEEAYHNLRERAAQRGIRLASDMVPNHMGIDSPWVVEHPDWFLSRWDSPYPAYSFNGPDLSSDPRVEIKIEDHYYNQSDAAVVFRRRDNHTGETRYVYHGNDGTSFPWNDTAQLNYLRADVREQVIQTILHVARQFPIIRFDAAMTLARKHVQRLWFPLPGTGGSIPSRAESSMTLEEFDAAMPHEFWREVVDRVAAEVPGTLLLAEAFWLLEGYFVRTLGMHRVYNSAFMNMLRDEENAKYRSVIKNTVEFDPDILKRYVNFMSNPDERTAIDQFGTGDKYFGVCTVMSTLPGLPMFGHGQIEAFTEKYGMEYKSPRYEEAPNEGLVERHQREIAPLLKNREVFAESAEFSLFDFYKDDGTVDENVFAYSNRLGDRRALVIFHNKYSDTTGTLHRSAAGIDKGTGALHQRFLHQALGLNAEDGLIFAYHDNATGLHYLRRSSELTFQGLRLQLRAYQYHVFQHWQELRTTDEYPWDALCDELNGRGVWNPDEALSKYRLRPLHEALQQALDPALLRCLADIAEFEDVEHSRHISRASQPPCNRDEALNGLVKRAGKFFTEANAALRTDGETAGTSWRYEAAQMYSRLLMAATRIPQLEDAFAGGWPVDARAVLPSRSPRVNAILIWAPVAAWCLVEALVKTHPIEEATTIFDRLYLRSALAESFHPLGLNGDDGYRAAARIRILLNGKERQTTLNLNWNDPDVSWLTGLHEVNGIRWFNKEAHEQLLWWTCLPELTEMLMQKTEKKAAASAKDSTLASAIAKRITDATEAAKKAGYRLDRMRVSSKVSAEVEGNIAAEGKTTKIETKENALPPEDLSDQQAMQNDKAAGTLSQTDGSDEGEPGQNRKVN